MKVLWGITHYTNNKAYALPKFREMLEACVVPVIGRENIWVVGDGPIFGAYPSTYDRCPGPYAEDMLIQSREMVRKRAIEDGYDKLVWSGVDWYFQSQEDCERLVSHDVDAVAPLIPARTDANKAVARHFIPDDEGFLTEEQEDVTDEELASGRLVASGFPGADSLVVKKELFDIPFAEGHKPWYARVEEGDPNVCVEEFWVLNALRRGHGVYVDTSTKVYHAHEDGTARLWKGIEKPLEDLSW